MSTKEQERKKDNEHPDAAVLNQIKGLPPDIAARVFELHAGLRHREYEATCALRPCAIAVSADGSRGRISLGNQRSRPYIPAAVKKGDIPNVRTNDHPKQRALPRAT